MNENKLIFDDIEFEKFIDATLITIIDYKKHPTINCWGNWIENKITANISDLTVELRTQEHCDKLRIVKIELSQKELYVAALTNDCQKKILRIFGH